MTTAPAPLAEPIEIAKFWKNRRRDRAIVVALNPFEGHTLIDCREYFVGSDGCMKPTTRGLSMVVRCLPQFSAAIRKALETARTLNLLPEEGSE
jgi:hypothetical protein